MLERLGFPAVGRHRRFVAAVAVDAIGSGIYMPVSVLYFLATTHLDASDIGLALSIAQMVALPLVLMMGTVVDRVGPWAVLLAANAAQALGYALYLTVDGFGSMLVLVSLVAIGQSMFWGSFPPMVALLSREGERELWFGFLGALRNLGFAAGGVVAGAIVTIGTVGAYHAVVVVDAVSYVVAFGLLLGVTVGRATAAASTRDERPQGSWSEVLAHRAYGLLVASNFCYAVTGMVLNVALPVYAIEVLGLPGWVTGAVFVLNTVMVGLGQGLVVRAMTGHRRSRVLVISWLFSLAGFLGFALAGSLGVAAAVVVFLAAVVVYTGGEMTGGPVLTAVAVDSAPDHLRGRYMSLYQVSWNVAGIVCPASLLWLLEQGTLPIWMVMTGVTLAALLLVTPLRRGLPVASGVVTNAATT